MNASLTYHVPEMSSYKQKASKNVDLSKYDPDKIYMMVYMADYDGTGSLQLHLPRIWENDARGKMPLAWGIAGSQAEDSHAFFNYMYQTATPNDYFVSTNAGGALSESAEPSAGEQG